MSIISRVLDYGWAIRLSALSGTNLLFLFLFQIIALGNLGLGKQTDIYFAGVVLPQFISLILSILIVNRLVPFFSSSNKEMLNEHTLNFAAIFFWISILFILLVIIFDEVFASFFFHNIYINNEHKLLSVLLLSTIFIPLNSINAVWTARYYSHDQYLKIEFLGIFSSIPAILLILLVGSNLTIISFIYISLLRLLILYILLSKRHIFKVLFFKNIKLYLSALKGSPEYFLNLIITKSDQLIDRGLISSIALPGILSIYSLAYQLILIVSSLLSKTFGNRTLKAFSVLFKENTSPRIYFKKFIKEILFFCFFIELVLIIFGHDILLIPLLHLNYSAESVHGIYLFIVLMSGLMIGGSARQVVENLFHASNESAIFAKWSTINFLIYLVFKVLAFIYFSVEGLCIAISIYSIVDPVILYLKKNKLSTL